MTRWAAILAAVAASVACAQGAVGIACLDDECGAFRPVASVAVDAGPTPDAGLIVAPALFAFAPAFRSSAYDAGAGMGTECGCVDVTGTAAEAVTFARASVAWCTKADYSLVECGSGKPRVQFDHGNPDALGILLEGTTKTNIVLRNRDLSNAAWTKSASMVCAKTSIGADGVALAASTCTSSGANQTVLQAVTVASALRNSSMYIRRRTGTGAVSVTRDNGSTWTAITSSLSSTVFKRVVSQDEIGCQGGGCIVVAAMTATAADPTIGVKLATSGDAVDIDLVQDETDAFPTSPITTAGSTVNRPAETASMAFASTTVRRVSWNETRSGCTAGHNALNLSIFGDTTHAMAPYEQADYTTQARHCSPSVYFANGGSQVPGAAWGYPAIGPVPLSFSNDGGFVTINVNGAITSAAATVTPATGMTSITLGGSGALQAAGQGGAILMSDLRIESDATASTVSVNRAVNQVAFVGDSIAAGSVSAPTTPQAALQALISRGVYNKGLPGDNAAGCLARYQNNVVGRGFKTLVWLCGTNDLIGGAAPAYAATIWATIKTALDDAKARGMTVIPVTILPKGGAPGWNADPMQLNMDTLNPLILAWCVSNNATCVDAYAAFGGEGGDAKVMLLTYDSGDGIHPNAAGSSYLATLIAAANPRHARPLFRPAHWATPHRKVAVRPKLVVVR